MTKPHYEPAYGWVDDEPTSTVTTLEVCSTVSSSGSSSSNSDDESAATTSSSYEQSCALVPCPGTPIASATPAKALVPCYEPVEAECNTDIGSPNPEDENFDPYVRRDPVAACAEGIGVRRLLTL